MELIAVVISGLVAFAVAKYNSHASEKKLQFELKQAEERLQQEFSVEYSAEAAIRALMSKGFALRSFNLIKHHIRGFDDSELKKLLLSSGCICFRVIDGKEFWGLLSENEHLLKERESMEVEGLKFFDLEHDDVSGMSKF